VKFEDLFYYTIKHIVIDSMTQVIIYAVDNVSKRPVSAIVVPEQFTFPIEFYMQRLRLSLV